VARIYLALFWAIGTAALVALGRRVGSFWAVLAGLAFYFFLPFSVIARRSFQPDPWMVMWILLTAWAALRWVEDGGWKWTLLIGIFGAAALLVKVVAAFFVGGMLVPLVIYGYGIKRVWRSPKVVLAGAMILAPSAAYYLLLNPQRSSSFLSFWTGSLSNLIWTSNFYADWLAMVKGLMGLGFFMAALLGVLMVGGRMKMLLLGAWAGYFAYGLVFPYQYATHEYYHLPLVALAALSLIPIVDAILRRLVEQIWLWRIAAGAIFVFASLYSLWVARSILAVNDFRTEPISWRQVGEAIPADGKFVALTADYGMRLRYYGWRVMAESWPSSDDLHLFSLAGNPGMDPHIYFNEITQGMDFFLVTAFSELDAQPLLKDELNANYPVYSEGDGYILYDLRAAGD
jgi:4-amino-4-deoxy-L-arabinose transferase-like glycosyltransferase